jgi:endo-1,4-beta-mannosidase
VNEAFRMGVNYWPASSAMRWWRRFDVAEVERDFARIAAAGGDLVRFFLLWEDFQPAPATVSEAALDRLVTVADLARKCSLQVLPTLFTGHMSGANFVPEWALGSAARRARFRVITGDRVVEREIRNWYADKDVFEAQAILARECARALSGHSALWGWDLGNENSNCTIPPTRDDGLRWLDRMAEAIRAVDPSCRITLGLHMEDLEQDRRIGPAEAARVCDVLCMHGYPMYASWCRSPTDPDLIAFLADVTRWLGGKDVLFAEFGVPTRGGDPQAETEAAGVLLSEQEAARYIPHALSRVHAQGTVGALVWCYADYAPAIWSLPPLDLAPHERHFGLWRWDGTPKPAAATLAEWRGRARAASPALDLPDAQRSQFYDAPRSNLIGLYHAQGLARPVL